MIPYTHFTSRYRQYCDVGITASECGVGLYQESYFAGELGGSQFDVRVHVVRFLKPRSRANWLDKKQGAVSDRRTEAEMISLDARQ